MVGNNGYIPGLGAEEDSESLPRSTISGERGRDFASIRAFSVKMVQKLWSKIFGISIVCQWSVKKTLNLVVYRW